MSSGIYYLTSRDPDLFYLQSNHFNEFGKFDRSTKQQIKADSRTYNHMLFQGDILFAAKGVNNFAVEYTDDIGPAVASSSFIILRIIHEIKEILLPAYLAWYITHAKKVRLFHQQKLGSTIASISMKELATLEISIPPVERQRLILQVQGLRDREKILTQQLYSQKDQLIYKQLLKAATQ